MLLANQASAYVEIDQLC